MNTSVYFDSRIQLLSATLIVGNRVNCGNPAVFLTTKVRVAGMSGYTQLSQGQHYQVKALYKAGHNQTMIANVLTVHKSPTYLPR